MFKDERMQQARKAERKLSLKMLWLSSRRETSAPAYSRVQFSQNSQPRQCQQFIAECLFLKVQEAMAARSGNRASLLLQEKL